MAEAVRIEVPDAADAAYLMQDLTGTFRAELVGDDRHWEIVVHPDRESTRLITDVLAAVHDWLDRTDAEQVTIHFGGHSYAMTAAGDHPSGLYRRAGSPRGARG